MAYANLEEAVEALRKSPDITVRAQCGDLSLEIRAIPSTAPSPRLGDALAALGPWEGETAEELTSRLREAREAGGSAEPPQL